MIIREVTAKYTKKELDALKNAEYISSPEDVYELFKHLREETKEHFIGLHLNTKHKIISFDTVSIGSLNASIVHPRELFKTAILANASQIILIHNHPSGNSRPSQEDITLTQRLVKAGDILGIQVIDHVVIGDSFTSFKEDGLI